MRAERDRPTPTITCLPRSSVSIHLQKDVDVLLKELKPCMRHVRATLSSFTDELRTLERLYYKNANQHRTALFFKRILETRRYGQRLIALNISEHVDCLYASFFGLATTLGVNQKPFKGTWTHVPTGTDVSFVLERISVTCKLLDKMCNQLTRAYQHFTLAMQSGAFVQLIVLFSALSSRMSTLLSEVLQVLRNSSRICDRLLVVLEANHRSRREVSAERQNEHVRCNTLLPPDAKTADLHSHLTENSPDRDCQDSPAELDVLPMLDIRTSQHPAQDVVPRDTQETVLCMPRIDAPTGSDLISTAGRRHKTKKVKKKRDEIDEIFSF
ncbi:hypothetical protein EDD17DRAFT_1752396 [Pisolithus thermaeus]|nr:hypothetical protein EDD17DRAFT_1752396 [Pisolithus thermaeus]